MSRSELPRKPADRRKYWLGLVVIAGLSTFGFSSFKNSMATYTMDFAQVRSSPGQMMQVPGVVDKSVKPRYDTAAGTFVFGILDVETRSQRMTVVSRQVKPSNFDQASQVVCIGTFAGDVFEARQLLVKCPSKEVEKLQAAG